MDHFKQTLSSLNPWNSSPTTTSKNGSDERSNKARLEVSEETRGEMFGDNASGRVALDSQSSSQSDNHGEGYNLRRTAPSMQVIIAPPSAHSRDRHASSGPSELIAVTPGGTGHLRDNLKYSEAVKGRVGYGRTEKDAAQAEVGNRQRKFKESEGQRSWSSKTLEDKPGFDHKDGHDLRPKPNKTEKESDRALKATLENETETLKHDIDRAQRQIKDLRNEVEAKRRRIYDDGMRYDHQRQELQTVKQQLRRTEIAYQRTQDQLAERTAELQSTQLFINLADTLSGADIVDIARALNTEILQSAALIAESLTSTGSPANVPDQVLSEVQETIGEDLTKALMGQRSLNGEDVDPTRVQLALQICLVKCSRAIIFSWTLGDGDYLLHHIYERIWNNERQSVAGRWRSIAQAHAAEANGPFQSLETIKRSVAYVLFVAGFHSQSLAEHFQEQLSMINKLALHLRSARGQQITSMDVVPFMIESGATFEPSEMDDTYAEERRMKLKISTTVEVRERVVGSTELGLMSIVKDMNGGIQQTIMLKPKVVLCTALSADD